jgi:hypothetical protein
MRSKEQILADIEATEEQHEMFTERLDTLYSELNTAEDMSNIVECAKELKKVQSAFQEAGFSESEAFQLMLSGIITSALMQ